MMYHEQDERLNHCFCHAKARDVRRFYGFATKLIGLITMCFLLSLMVSCDEIKTEDLITHTIVFDFNHLGSTDVTYNLSPNEKIIDYAPIIDRQGYIFVGWFDNIDGEGMVYNMNKTLDEDLILYAKWTIIDYVVTYHIDDEVQSVIGNITETYASLMSEPVDNLGRVFAGWYDNPFFEGNPINASAHINQNCHLFAKWENALNKLIYYSNIPGEEPVALDISTETNITQLLPELERYGYIFEGWYSDSSLKNLVDTDAIKDTERTLYAGWVDINTTYFVSTNGNDQHNGSAEKPLKSFIKAIELMTPGDTMMVYAGTYQEQLIIDKSGTEDAWLTFMAMPNEEVIIDGTGIDTEPGGGLWYGMIVAVGYNHIIIEGFTVINSTASAIFVGDNHHVNIRNNHTINSQNPGIFAWNANDLIIEGNEVEYACMHPESGLEDISLRNNKRVIIRHNYVHHSDNIGIDTAGGVQHAVVHNNLVEYTGLGIYVDAWDGELFDIQIYDNVSRYNEIGLCVNVENNGSVNNVKVFDNLIYGNRDDGMVIGWGGIGHKLTISQVSYFGNKVYDNLGDGIVIYAIGNAIIDHIYIYNNFVYDNMGCGITMSGLVADVFYQVNHVWIVHNTIHDNGSEHMWFAGGIGIGNQENAMGIMTNIYVLNNIVSANHTFSIAVWPYGKQPDDIMISHNLIDQYRGALNYGETKGLQYIEADPQFTSLTNRDFHLTSLSPAIDAAYDIEMIDVDYDNDPRSAETKDVGADEFVN